MHSIPSSIILFECKEKEINEIFIDVRKVKQKKEKEIQEETFCSSERN
jgi:hypothetical protein